MEGQKEVDEVIGTDPHGKEPEQVKSDIYTMPEEFYVNFSNLPNELGLLNNRRRN